MNSSVDDLNALQFAMMRPTLSIRAKTRPTGSGTTVGKRVLHAKGYQDRNGKPFVVVKKNGTHKPLTDNLLRAFQDWAYAGWVVSECDNIAPKTIRGNWESIVSTEEFETAQAILVRRNQQRTLRRKQDYLLAGFVHYRYSDGRMRRMSGSTSNAGRSGGGTPYYRIVEPGAPSFLCVAIDTAVEKKILAIQVDPDLMPLIRASYTHKLQEKLGHSRPA
jgi:hypothetical protein